jgi:hypothetical protein
VALPLPQIMQAQNTAANTEAGTIAAKQAAILSAAAFVAKHWKNADVLVHERQRLKARATL